MATLLLFAWRELRRSKGRAALIALILTIQAAALGGGYLAQQSLYFTRDTWSDKLHLADLDVHFVPASVDEMPSLDTLRRIPGVAAAERRFISFGYIEKSDGAPLPVVVEYLDPKGHPAVNDVEVLSGHWLTPGKPDVALVDRSFAAAHALSIGDELVVNPRRLESRFKVGGTGLSAEHLVPTANPELLVPHKGSLGVIYASRESLDTTFPDKLYNDVAVTFEKGADTRVVTDAVLAALGKLDIERVVTKSATFGYRFIEVMLAGSRSVTPIIAFLTALMASIVAFISVHRLIAERRREIGCLLAQGYSPAQLAACFFGLGLVPGIAGATAGVPSAMLFAQKVTRTTASISGFPDPIMDMSTAPRWLALGAGSAILVGLLSALPPAIGLLRTRPSDALRRTGELNFVGLPSVLERLVAGSTSVRYALRNVFRRSRLSLATATLVALAVALPSGLLTTISSWDSWAQDQAAILGWDAIASFKVPLAEAHIDELMADKGIASWDGYVQGYAPMRREDGIVEEMRVRGIPIGSDLIRFHLTSGRAFTSDDTDEAVLNSGFAAGRPVHLGEVVTLLRGGVSHRFRVVGLITDATLSTIILPRITAQRLFGLEGKMSGAYLRYGAPPAGHAAAPAALRGPQGGEPAVVKATNAEITEKIDIDDTAPREAAQKPHAARDPKSALLGDDLVTSVEIRTEFADANLRYLAAFNVIIIPFVGLSGVLAFFFLVSVLGFLLIERETEYATLRSMGYTGFEIARIVLTEIGVLAASGLVLSTLTWAATAYALRGPMAQTWFWIPLDLRLHDFCVCALPTCLFLGLAAVPGIRALVQMNLSAALRGRAIG
jgi:ABC-type lipoprotein release transport system permease subunit